MSRDSVLRKKSFDFAIRVINLYKYLKEHHKEYDLARQLLRSGTSVGAMIREAEQAESKRDFLHKLTIGLKEINECIYWLELLFMTGFIDQLMFDSIKKGGEELLKMLIASIKTTKTRL